jgi:2-oxo-3-hexenedioate decarboxylase/2-keto-4-pentenoate hydratase
MSTAPDPAAAADWLLDRHTRRPPFVGDMPAALRPADMAAAYRIQAELAERRTHQGLGPAVGWKVGGTTPGMQRLLRVTEPCAGRILESGVRAPGAVFEHAAFCRPAVECEIAMMLAAPLDARGGRLTRRQVAAAVASLHAAFEVVDDRYGDYQAAGAALMAADDFFHTACVVGPGVEAGLDPGTLTGAVHVGEREAARGSAADVLGHPWESLIWLADCLAAQGQVVEAGSLVMTGSMTLPVWAARGDALSMTIDGLGSVTARFE